MSGYYRPVAPVRIGDWSLDHVFLAQPADFERRAAGPQDGASSPVTIRFARAGAASGTGEPGGVSRILATTWSVADSTVRFEGRSPELGRVVFDGRLDQGALATARRNLGGDGVVLTGALTAGGQTARDVRLTWWMGD
ncbi:MAG: hypothetical protein ACK4JY_04120 [Brevundimonas sp.]|uniref:hypothetical protein n=1 Tax=Brevundimonas sp. TaxID=1871086 RepID=UPI00391954B2